MSDLVGACPGGKAAFAEDLHVDALATDGYPVTLDDLNRDAVPKASGLRPP